MKILIVMINKLILAITLCVLGNNLIGQTLGGNQRGLRNQQGFNPINQSIEPNESTPPDAVSYTHLTLPTILLV